MKDNELQGNEKIEEAIAALQQEPTQEMLAHTLTVIRRRMQEKGQFVIAVEPPPASVLMDCPAHFVHSRLMSQPLLLQARSALFSANAKLPPPYAFLFQTFVKLYS